MVGVTFGTKHSYDDFGLILSSKEIGLPSPKTESVSVPGMDGEIDLTEALNGAVAYGNRKLTFNFTVLRGADWPNILSGVSNYLHGKKMKVTLDEDKDFYYYGRCRVDEYQSNKTIGTLVVECDADPYKAEVNGPETPWEWNPFSFVNGIAYVNEASVDGSLQVDLVSRGRDVSPTFTCSTAMAVTHNGVTYSLPKGTTTVYGIHLQEGDNYVTFEGAGTVTITYKGGSL